MHRRCDRNLHDGDGKAENLDFTSDNESDAEKDEDKGNAGEDDAGDDEDAPKSLSDIAEEPELADAEGIAALQNEIAARQRKKHSDRKQEVETERRVVQIRLRLRRPRRPGCDAADPRRRALLPGQRPGDLQRV